GSLPSQPSAPPPIFHSRSLPPQCAALRILSWFRSAQASATPGDLSSRLQSAAFLPTAQSLQAPCSRAVSPVDNPSAPGCSPPAGLPHIRPAASLPARLLLPLLLPALPPGVR